MLYAILLLILAVLLFGASAVLGVICRILGGFVAVAALVWFGVVLHVSPLAVAAGGLFGIIGVLGLSVLVLTANAGHERERIEAELKAKADAAAAEHEALMRAIAQRQ